MRMRIGRGGKAPVRATVVIVASLTLGVLGSSFGRPAAATSTERRLQQAQAKLADLIDQVGATKGRQAAVERSLSGVLVRIDATRRELESATAQLGVTDARERKARAEVASEQALIDRRAAELYMNPLSSMEMILGSTSVADLVDRVHYVHVVAQSDRAMLDGLARRIAALRMVRSQIAAGRRRLDTLKATLSAQASKLTAGLRRQQDLVASLNRDIDGAQAMVTTLKDRRAREAGAAALRKARGQAPPPPSASPSPPSPSPSSPPSPSPSSSPSPQPDTSSVRQLITNDFAPLGQTVVEQALCVANRESGFTASAENPYSGAAGVFQFLPQVWPSLLQAAGYGGRSVFDAAANVGTAAWDVARFGWAAWNADGPSCGV
jgi:peptidoglycan hydrolase CwlO-like protein